jgi:hypothetical protein
MSYIRQSLTLSLAFAVAAFAGDGPTKKRPNAAAENAESAQSGVLWVAPVDLESRNLFFGSGGQARAPHGAAFTFDKEDMNGSNPKLDVHADDGVKWKLKLGSEARPETAATRFVWALGYFTTDNYLVPKLRVDELPQHLHRGQNLIGPGGVLHDARLKRNPAGYEKAGTWRWKEDPFTGTREYNGLRVLMALMNNWDLKDSNNEILERKKDKDKDKDKDNDKDKDPDNPAPSRPERLFIVSDLGASFGSAGIGLQHNQRKGNLAFFKRAKFISRVTPEYVDFSVPARPGMILLFNPKDYFMRVHLEWIGRRIPRADARWAGELLARLSDAQIRDAFRAGGFSPEEIDGFTAVVETRINALKNL